MKAQPGILKNKTYLYLTEFFAGMAVMAVELGASRLLAPYFSSSQIVWTIIIATIMIAMALGNIYGGKSADKDPSPDRLYRRLLIAAIWIAAIPVLGKYIIIGITGLLVIAVNQNLLIIAAFIACMVIFVFPCFLLGTCTPSLARYTVSSLDDSGRTVGTLGAFNTIGSIIGTFLPTFVTIPAVGTAVTFLIFSGILLLIALAFFLSAKKGLRTALLCVLLFALCLIFGRSRAFAFWEEDLSYEGESVYNYLQVKEDEKQVVLSTNVLFGVQSVMQKDGELTGLYYDTALAAPVMTGRETPSVLVLGNGTGTYAGQCLRYFPGSRVEGVEIDGKITQLAESYFAMPAEVAVTEYDGRAFLQAVDSRYDVILVDAYQDITIPFQMSSVEFFEMARDHLLPGGVLAVNMNMHSDGEGSINEYLCDTIASVFPFVATADVPGTTNRELFASMKSAPAALLQAGLEQVEEPALAALLRRVSERLQPYEGGAHLLSDDKAPVELLGMRAIDRLIADEMSWYRDLYEREGLSGVLASFGIG